MVSEGVKVAPIIYEYRDRHPKESCKKVQNVHSQHNSEAVKSAYYRWNPSGQKNADAKRSDSVSKDNGTNSKKGGSAGKGKNTPSNLTKIDEVAVEKYLCALYDLTDPKENIARLIVNWIDRKGVISQEEPIKIEFIGVDKDEQIALAEAYRADIESKIPR